MSLALSIGCAAPNDSDESPPSAATIFDLTASLTAAQLEVNARIAPGQPVHPFEGETELDREAHRLLHEPWRETARTLGAFARQGGGEQQAAGARALITLAQQRLAEGCLDEAGAIALDVYLSSSPTSARREAFRLICAAAPIEKAEHWLGLVLAGKQDAWLRPGEAEWRAAIERRR